jgi:hypothetical protein
MFTEQQQSRLKATVRPKIGEEYQSTTNHELEKTIEQLKLESPERFLNKHSIENRRFYHQPRSVIPMAGFVEPLKIEFPT